MFEDELDDDSSSASGPVHPDDRLWRHPSEVGAALGASAPTATARHAPSRIWSVALLAGLTGAAVAITTLAVTGTFSKPVVDTEARITPISTIADPAPTPKAVSRVAVETAAVLAQIKVMANGRERNGSGVVVRADGMLVTTEALVEGADQVIVTLAGGRVLAGTVAGTDPYTNLAVVHVPATGLRMAVAAGTKPAPGDATVVVTGAGSSAEGPWVTSGVVSQVNQQVKTGDDGGSLSGLIETSTVLPTKADGSALVAADGSLLGVNIVLSAGSAELDPASGYAVPMDVADSVAAELIHYGRARTAWLGVQGDPQSTTRTVDLRQQQGARVAGVMANSPAEAAGLQEGDVVVAIGDRPVATMEQLIGIVHLHRPAETVPLIVSRDGTRHTISVTLAEKP